MIDERSRQLFRAPVIGELAAWLQARGWMLCVLSFEDKKFWLQANKAGVVIESEIRGTGDLRNACQSLAQSVLHEESKRVQAKEAV